jgi:hypothetical protein
MGFIILHRYPRTEFLYRNLMVFIPRVTTKPMNLEGDSKCDIKTFNEREQN